MKSVKTATFGKAFKNISFFCFYTNLHLTPQVLAVISAFQNLDPFCMTFFVSHQYCWWRRACYNSSQMMASYRYCSHLEKNLVVIKGRILEICHGWHARCIYKMSESIYIIILSHYLMNCWHLRDVLFQASYLGISICSVIIIRVDHVLN